MGLNVERIRATVGGTYTKKLQKFISIGRGGQKLGRRLQRRGRKSSEVMGTIKIWKGTMTS